MAKRYMPTCGRAFLLVYLFEDSVYTIAWIGIWKRIGLMHFSDTKATSPADRMNAQIDQSSDRVT